MKFLLICLLTLSPALSFAETPEEMLENAVQYTEWLEQHMKEFGACTPSKKDDSYELCDKTKISRVELKSLFSKKPQELVDWIQAKGIHVQILCDSSKTATDHFKDQCLRRVDEKSFQGVSSLHGKFLPEQNAILLRSSATPGSLIHEYLHSLQSSNPNPVFGKKYKSERNRIQQSLLALMDKKTLEIRALELKKPKDDALIQGNLKVFSLASQILSNFGNWQDLIDERNLFLLYTQFGAEFGAKKDDLDLSRKNLGFICKNSKLKPLLTSGECK